MAKYADTHKRKFLHLQGLQLVDEIRAVTSKLARPATFENGGVEEVEGQLSEIETTFQTWQGEVVKYVNIVG